MTAPLHLGIDVGSSGVRGVAIDAEGRVAAQASRPLPTPEPQDGVLVQDPEIWWRAVAAVLAEASAAAGPGRIASLAVDGTMTGPHYEKGFAPKG